MCGSCGCAAETTVRLLPSGESGLAQHGEAAGSHVHEHQHGPGGGPADRTVALQQKILARNDAIAGQNRDWLQQRGLLAINLMSSPGSGKTTLLERTARDLARQPVISVIEGDQETTLDAARIRAAGCRVVQINTGTGCHLDAAMVADALQAIDPPRGSVVVIENVGNLVCPALFDLGEAARVVLTSVTEGADKPAKYPHMFRSADLVLVTKTDLLPHVDFDVFRCTDSIAQVSPGASVLHLSAVSGAGMGAWYVWLRRRAAAPVSQRTVSPR
jgi:hydrogenase nickel incorporation protein HypB